MTCCIVSVPVVFHLRFFCPADLTGIRTPGVEMAALRRIDRTGNLPLEYQALFLPQMGVCLRYGIQKKYSVRMKRVVVKVFLWSDFADPSKEHNRNPVCDKVYDREVVANE